MNTIANKTMKTVKDLKREGFEGVKEKDSDCLMILNGFNYYKLALKYNSSVKVKVNAKGDIIPPYILKKFGKSQDYPTYEKIREDIKDLSNSN